MANLNQGFYIEFLKVFTYNVDGKYGMSKERKVNFKSESRRKHMSELSSMMNIGKEMAKKLSVIGIDSSEKLIEAGAKQTFLNLKEVYPQVCLVHLYALEGAIHNIEFNNLPEEKKKELKEFSDFLKT